VCNSSCHLVAGATAYCGDGTTQGGNGETCDDSNTVTESCAYGQTSCTVCNASCKSVAGATSRCGDGITDMTNGEECDTSGASTTCTASCKLQKYCILDFTQTGTFRLQGAPAGNGNYAQTGGALRLRLPDVNGAPGNGPAAILYYKMPTKFTTSSFGTTATTDLVTTAGTPTNVCPLNTGTLTGTNLTFPSCPYDNRNGHHCSNNWTPTDQNPPTITPTNGCLKVTATGTIMCSGGLCGFAGLTEGTTNINDTWYQPENTATFNAAFTTGHNGATGETTTCNDSNDTSTNPDDDYFEVPERVGGRSWLRTDGTRTAILCGQLPATGCP
jgi:hypothetical protein